MTLRELYAELERHDWFYEMSDDQRVWNEGLRKELDLQRKCQQVEGGTALYAAFTAHHFSGPAWGTTKKPKPPLPEEVAK